MQAGETANWMTTTIWFSREEDNWTTMAEGKVTRRTFGSNEFARTFNSKENVLQFCKEMWISFGGCRVMTCNAWERRAEKQAFLSPYSGMWCQQKLSFSYPSCPEKLAQASQVFFNCDRVDLHPFISIEICSAANARKHSWKEQKISWTNVLPMAASHPGWPPDTPNASLVFVRSSSPKAIFWGGRMHSVVCDISLFIHKVNRETVTQTGSNLDPLDEHIRKARCQPFVIRWLLLALQPIVHQVRIVPLLNSSICSSVVIPLFNLSWCILFHKAHRVSQVLSIKKYVSDLLISLVSPNQRKMQILVNLVSRSVCCPQ